MASCYTLIKTKILNTICKAPAPYNVTLALPALAFAFFLMTLFDSAGILIYTLPSFFPALRSSCYAIFSTGIYFSPLFFRMIPTHCSALCLNVISSEKPSLILPIQILFACKDLTANPLIVADIAILNYVFICVIFA